MLPTVIAQEIVIDAPPELVWGVVTEPEQISQWYTDATELDLRPGGAGAFIWKEHGTVPLRVETVDKPSRFAFRWCYPEGAEPKTGNSIRVEFKKDSLVIDVNGELQEIPNDFVWIFAGGEPPTAFLKKVGVRVGLRDMTAEGSSEAKQSALVHI